MSLKRTLVTATTCLAILLSQSLPHVLAQQQTASVPIVFNEAIKINVASNNRNESNRSLLTLTAAKLVLTKKDHLTGNLKAEILLYDDADFMVYCIVKGDGGQVVGVDSHSVSVRESERSRKGMTFRNIDFDFGVSPFFRQADRLTVVIRNEPSPVSQGKLHGEKKVEIEAGTYTGACQVMTIGPDGVVSYDDTPLGISHLEITADDRLKVMFPDRTLGRGKWHARTLTKVSDEPHAAWSTIIDDITYKATAIPFSPRMYVFHLEVTEHGRLIAGAKEFYAVDLKGE